MCCQEFCKSCNSLFGVGNVDVARFFVRDIAKILYPGITVFPASEECAFAPFAILALWGIADIDDYEVWVLCESLVDQFQGSIFAVACMVNDARSKLLLCF